MIDAFASYERLVIGARTSAARSERRPAAESTSSRTPTSRRSWLWCSTVTPPASVSTTPPEN